VAEREGNLYCDGVVTLGEVRGKPRIGSPLKISSGSPANLRIEVYGPGHVRARFNIHLGYESRAGHIRSMLPFDFPPPVSELKNRLYQK
jgi:hypothetical protein